MRRWVVTHGLAINVTPQMDYFTYINPCGHADSVMTSLAQIVSPCPSVQDVASVLTACSVTWSGYPLAGRADSSG